MLVQRAPVSKPAKCMPPRWSQCMTHPLCSIHPSYIQRTTRACFDAFCAPPPQQQLNRLHTSTPSFRTEMIDMLVQRALVSKPAKCMPPRWSQCMTHPLCSIHPSYIQRTTRACFDAFCAPPPQQQLNRLHTSTPSFRTEMIERPDKLEQLISQTSSTSGRSNKGIHCISSARSNCNGSSTNIDYKRCSVHHLHKLSGWSLIPVHVLSPITEHIHLIFKGAVKVMTCSLPKLATSRVPDGYLT